MSNWTSNGDYAPDREFGPTPVPSLNLRGWFADDLLTLHAGCDAGGHRPVLKIDKSGYCLQLETWDGGELVSVDQLGSYAADGFGRAFNDFTAELATRAIA